MFRSEYLGTRYDYPHVKELTCNLYIDVKDYRDLY